MRAGVPDGNFFGLPRFHRPDRNGFGRNQRNVSATRSAGILGDGERMQVDDARRQSAIFRRRGRLVLVLAFAPRRIVERPMFHIPLPSLHHCAAHAFPRLAVGRCVCLGKMEILRWHQEFRPDAIETKLAIGALEGKRMVDRYFCAVEKPFVHSPEMR